jgi:acetolactate synthase-1/2/3 large subunit
MNTTQKQPESEKIYAVHALIKILEEEGVQYVFGIPGSHTLAIFDALRESTIKVILTKHECGAAYMADGYARVKRQVGVCTGTVGPGATNLVTGIAASYSEGIPVLALTGLSPASTLGKTAHQEASGLSRSPNQIEIFRNITKASMAIPRASQLPHLVRLAFRIMLTGRFGPVNLSFPADILYDQIVYEQLAKKSYRVTRSNNVDFKLITQAVELIQAAKSPVIIAGQRCLFPDATQELLKLVDQYKIPVLTPLSAKGVIPENHPMALGCTGLFGHAAAEHYLTKVSDLIIAIGEDFEEWASLAWDPEIIKDKELIQIDLDPLEIGKNYPVTLGIDGTIRTVIDALREQLDACKCPPRNSDEDMLSYKKQYRYFEEPQMFCNATPLKPQRVIHDLRQLLPQNTIVFGDAGHTVRWVGKYFHSYPQSFFAANNFEPMGYAVAACIGGKLAKPECPVVCICGDGSFLMHGMELSTAVNYGIPVIWIILNDSRLNMIYTTQTVYFGKKYVASEFSNPDFAQLAQAFGANGFTITQPGELETVIPLALSSTKPSVINIIIDPNEIPPFRPRSLKIPESIRLGSPQSSPEANAIMLAMIKDGKVKSKI